MRVHSMAGRIPHQFIDELLNRVDIVDLINGRVPLKKAGKDYQACCPFHDEKTPSFTVSREKQFYHCFGCGAHGTAISFLMEYDNLGFIEAVEELAAREGLEVPREGGRGNQGPDQRPLHDILAQAASYYQNQLRRHPQAGTAVDYLKQRGLSGEIAARFGIGFAPPGSHNLMQSLGTTPERLQQLWTAGMVAESEDGRRYDRFRNRIMFPIRDHRGQTIGFGGRILGDGKPKYLNSPETPLFHKSQELYGLYEARKAVRKLERLLVVEGYMDVVALAQFGIPYGVATLGTATTEQHVQRLFRSVSEIIFCFDGDRAGRDAAWKALTATLPLMRDGREARFLFLPDGEDPDSLIRKEGAERFQQRIAEATPLSNFLFDKLAEEVDMSTQEGRVKLAEQATPLLQRLPAGLFHRMMEKRLEQLLGISIEQKAGRPGGASGDRRGKRGRRPTAFPGTITPVRRAIILLLNHPAFAQGDELASGWENLPLPGVSILKELLEILQTEPNLTTATLLERWRERDEGRHLSKLIGMCPGLPKEELEKEFRDTLASLAHQALAQELDDLTERARHSGLNETEKARFKQLLAEKGKRDRG